MKIGTSVKHLVSVATVSVILVANLAACGGSDNGSGNSGTQVPPTISTTQAPEPTVVIQGQAYTCGQIVNAEGCGENTQKAFNKYGQNIDRFVNSGQLGPFNESSYEDRAFAGLVACVYKPTNQNDYTEMQNKYIDYMQTQFADQERIAFLPVWFAATRDYLCPTNQNPGSNPLP